MHICRHISTQKHAYIFQHITQIYIVEVVISNQSNVGLHGPDGVNNRLLKGSATEIGAPLAELFNKSITLAMVPITWKKFNICPIYKKDDKSIVSNYRPITLLSCVVKVYRYIKQTIS